MYGVYIRHQREEPRIVHTYPALTHDTALSNLPCVACNAPLANGEPIATLVLGPGDDAEERAKCAAGTFYNATATVLHAACAGVDHESDET